MRTFISKNMEPDYSKNKTVDLNYKVKEDVLLENLLTSQRSDKAKVLRIQQLKDNLAWQGKSDQSIRQARIKTYAHKNVSFSPRSIVQDAIKEGNKFEVLELLNSGVPVNFNDVQGEGMTLLHQACAYDDYIIAQTLIKQGASVNMLDDYHCTPLHICCLYDSLKCAQLLIANNALANVMDLDSNFAVDLAAENSHMKAMMKKYVRQKLNVDEDQLSSWRNKTQKTMLQDIKVLLEQGSSVDSPNTSGITLLHVAVTNGYLSVARLLLENSANVNVADSHLWTPLHCAAKYRQAKMVKLLLSHYANPHARTTSNLLPKDMTRNTEIVKMLTDAEETFLDLDNQKTPSKTKRFSASLLDQNDREEISRVQTRIISSTKICKRDIIREKEILQLSSDVLTAEIKQQIAFQPPNINSSFLNDISWDQVLPPPIPPRDAPQTPNQSQTFSAVKLQHRQITNLHDEKLLKAVVTIQRAFRKYLHLPRRKISRMLCKIEEVGNIFCDQVVIQNAEDIANESDRQRALKMHQRKSWSAKASNPMLLHIKNDRPMSTGYLMEQMSYAPDPGAVWLPQDPGQHQTIMENTYQQMPPDVVPYCGNNQVSRMWSTMPHRGQRGKSAHHRDSIDSGLSMMSNSKDLVELTGTVKRSLTIKDKRSSYSKNATSPPSHAESIPVRLRKSSLGAMRPATNYTTYRMPPLTPTVATLIHHTTTVKQDEELDDNHSHAKVMQPVDEIQPNHFHRGDQQFLRHKFHSMKTPGREHRYGSLLSDRGRILRDNRLAIGNVETSPVLNRHSWDGQNKHFQSETDQEAPVYQNLSSNIAMNRFSDEVTTSFAGNLSYESRYLDVTLPRRKSSNGPPPPPRRNPGTRLSDSSDRLQVGSNRKGSLTSFNQTTASSTVPLESQTLPRPTKESFPSVVPPPLPDYTPQVVINKRKSLVGEDLPPPPAELLSEDSTVHFANNLRVEEEERQIYQQEDSFSFPPPPTL